MLGLQNSMATKKARATVRGLQPFNVKLGVVVQMAAQVGPFSGSVRLPPVSDGRVRAAGRSALQDLQFRPAPDNETARASRDLEVDRILDAQGATQLGRDLAAVAGGEPPSPNFAPNFFNDLLNEILRSRRSAGISLEPPAFKPYASLGTWFAEQGTRRTWCCALRVLLRRR